MRSPSTQDPQCNNRTIAHRRFFKESSDVIGFIGYISSMALHIDRTVKIAAEALLPGSRNDAEREKYSKEMTQGGSAAQTLRGYQQLIYQTAICRSVDNFFIYLSDTLASVFINRPETLRSSETVTLAYLLKHKDYDELINALAERKVNKLAYQGLRDLVAYLKDELGFELFLTPEDLNRAVLITEIRNLIVHNRCVVNKIVLTKLPDLQKPLGQQITLEFDAVFDDMKFLNICVHEIDIRAIEKFKLPSEPDGPHCPKLDTPLGQPDSSEQ